MNITKNAGALSSSDYRQTRAQNDDPNGQNEALDVMNKLAKFRDDPTVETPTIDSLVKAVLGKTS